MKSSQLLAAGLLSAACLAGGVPSNAQTLHRNPATVQRIGPRLAGQAMSPQQVFPQLTTPFELGPGQTRTLGSGIVTGVRATTLSVRFMSGRTGFITLSPRVLQMSRLHTGSRIMAILRSDGSVLIFPINRMNARVFHRPAQ
jgi:hypothetical protein